MTLLYSIAFHLTCKSLQLCILDVLSKVGGFDIAGMCGIFLGGALYRVPVLIDGFISAVAALCALRLCPAAGKAMLASHASAEPAALVRTNGKGELVLAGDAELAGGFHGTVRVAPDATLVVSALPPPPGEEVVPSANRVEWFDPDAEGALYCPDASTRPLCVSALYPRTESGVVSGGHAMCGLSGGTDRRPWKNAVARGDGPVRTWLDFDNTYNEGSGNTLRHKNAYNNGTDSTPIGDVREVFMVLDTSRGGGTPLGTAVGCEYTARDGSGKDISKPIWRCR